MKVHVPAWEKMMIKIAIVDDEKNALDLIHTYVERELLPSDEAEIFTFTKADDLLERLEDGLEIDIVIADVEMPGMNGIELGRRINALQRSIYLIFITAYANYAAESYTIEAYQYILKNDMDKRFSMIFRRLMERVKREKRQYKMIGTPTNKETVYYRDIVYITKAKGAKYVRYITVNGEYTERISLNQAREELESREFLQIERGYIININHIAAIHGNCVYMDNGEQVVISRARLKKVREEINLYRGSL